ncbi:RNA repair domain-containing protein [Desulfosediminicola ganghwensis]|nr:RNA repair domain-containing protein [Desulfosediminicola ganghwensis]
MIPIHKLLARIRWDTQYAKHDFKIGYYDRIEAKIVIVPIK